jgi:hypothetical protein
MKKCKIIIRRKKEVVRENEKKTIWRKKDYEKERTEDQNTVDRGEERQIT